MHPRLSPPRRAGRAALLALPILAACTGDPATRKGPAGGDDTGGDDTGTPVVEGCRADPGAADKDRAVLVSLPYGSSGSQADTWAVLRLGSDGVLADTGQRLAPGRATGGTVAFTPDGSVAIAPLEDGTLGVFAVDPDGTATVVQAGFDAGAYAVSVTIDPTGEVAWIVDGNWPDNGGGLYRAPIDCQTGEVGAASRVVEAKLPAALLQRPGDPTRGVLVGREVPGAGEGADVALLDLESGSVLGGADVFGDEEAIVSSAAWHRAGWVLVADYSEWSGIPNRIGVARWEEDHLEARGVVSDVYDPVAIVPSPTGTGAVVASGYGDAYELLTQASDGDQPWSHGWTVDESGAAPVQLPGTAVGVNRGPLAGRILATEVEGVRSLDLVLGNATLGGVLALDSGIAGITGAIGVQP